MILVDVNVLLCACDAASPHHEAARRWWEERLSRPQLVRLAWVTMLAFVRIGTHPRVFEQPLSAEEATALVEQWLARPMVDVLGPGERHWHILAGLIRDTRATGNLVTDAHLAALAIEHGATLASADRDFARFPGLDWINPLS